MSHARRIVVYVATSADGYIARKDGGFEWLDRPRPKGNYGMDAFLRSVDTIFWGRKTYELALRFGDKGSNFGKPMRHFVFSRSLRAVAPGFELVRGPLRDFVRQLRAGPGRDVWVMGGAELIASLLDEGEIDVFDLHVVPTLIGEGIPLLAPRHRLVPLKLQAVRRFTDGVVRLRYAVERSRTPPAASHAAGRRPPGRGRSHRREKRGRATKSR